VLPSSSSSDRVDIESRNQEQMQDSEKDGDESSISGMHGEKLVDDIVKKEWEEVVWLFAERGVLKVRHLKFSSGYLTHSNL
jgi:hypothetical protein